MNETINVCTEIGAPKSAAWELLADFGRPHNYASGIVDARLTSRHSAGVGTIRHCDLAPMMMMKQYIVEEVTEWTEGQSITYKIVDSSSPIKNSHVVWRVTGDETSSRISVRVVYTPSGVMARIMAGTLRRLFNKQMAEAVADMKRFLESKPQLRAA